MTLQELNQEDETIIRESLKHCCGSEAWAERMITSRPFADVGALLSASDSAWNSLAASDWLQAFAQHPKIGQKSASQWSKEEQRGMQQASSATAVKMNQLNAEYERKFGWIFIVCATGKSADELLVLISARVQNDPDSELRIAAEEQSKITKLRLQKLIDK